MQENDEDAVPAGLWKRLDVDVRKDRLDHHGAVVVGDRCLLRLGGRSRTSCLRI